MASQVTCFPVYPPEETRCIWMTAGVLSYRICDRRFECDSCPVDTAMRGRPAEAQREAGSPESAGGGSPSQPDRRYTSNHCWTLPVRQCVLRIGIVPTLSRALQDPRSIVLPMAGQRLQRDQTCVWFVMDGGTLALGSPVSGRVSRVNSRIAAEPHLAVTDPLETGWLCEIEWTSRSVEEPFLLTGDEAARIYESEAGKFRESLLSAIGRGKCHVGETLPDGGLIHAGLPALVGATRYVELLGRAFSMH